LAEFDRVLKAKFAIPASVVSDFIEELNLHHVQTTSSSEVGTMDFIRDPDDRVVVSRALSAGASVLLTGDRDILDVREQIAGLSVYTPRDFWESLRAEGE
jgi:predicted nucleic acid-binding protein